VRGTAVVFACIDVEVEEEEEEPSFLTSSTALLFSVSFIKAAFNAKTTVLL
jgi:hypothetical protein